MIPLSRLVRLTGRARLRKAILVLTDIQTGLMAGRYGPPEILYTVELARFLESDATTPGPTISACRILAAVQDQSHEAGFRYSDSGLLRAIDNLRHVLMADTGQSGADWDLIDPATGKLESSSRKHIPGMRVYCEDIRSPFNLGSIFRTSDAFGVAELLLSPGCADPAHPRCFRSAMGAADSVSHRRSGLDTLACFGPAFALELGGTDIVDFDFPEKGIVVLGSEELGVSPEALALCSLGKVSIPMSGTKGSLNVAVAAGILLHAWRSSLGL